MASPYVQVTATAARDYTVEAPQETVMPARGSITFTVKFDPSEGGTRDANIRIDSDDADEAVYAFYITGAGE
ncbi:MAG: hypothetical protein HRT88_04890 [Lentisphaeraceae bacterium]|nr:hypothetical protein [Lentisphaeraceae bacterium]